MKQTNRSDRQSTMLRALADERRRAFEERDEAVVAAIRKLGEPNATQIGEAVRIITRKKLMKALLQRLEDEGRIVGRVVVESRDGNPTRKHRVFRVAESDTVKP